MKQIVTLLTIAVLLVFSSACTGKKPLDQSGLQGKNVLSVLRDISAAYEKKDLPAFMDNVAPEYRDREAFSRTLTTVFSQNESIRFNVHYDKMLIMVEKKGPIKAMFNWDGEWFANEGTSRKDGGRVTLVFDPGSFKLSSIEGKNPFLAQPGEMPGKQ